MLFTGSYTALLTPFKNGEVDYDAYRKLVDFQIDNGTHGLVPVGTTGESATLNKKERAEIFSFANSNTDIPLMAGVGSSSTAEAIELVECSLKNGIKKCLAVIFKNLNLQISHEKKLDANSINLKNSFSLIWCNFLEMIVSISIIWKKHHSNLGCWYLAGTCALNQMYNTKDFKFDLNSENYTENFFLKV